MSASKQRITLEEQDFALLVRGGVVTKGKVAIILADIGWDRLEGIIANAQVADWEAKRGEWKKRKGPS